MSTSRPQLVVRTDTEAVTVLTLNRPDKLNALSPDLFRQLRAHLDQILEAGDRISCVVIEGAGRSFCAGADLDALKAGTEMEEPEFRSKTVEKLGNLPQAVIASVHGHCYTGGLELALAADILVAADDAVFCDTHARLGIVPRWGMTARLPRRVGVAAAKMLAISGRPIDAREALRIGLCDKVVARSELRTFTEKLASDISGYSAGSISAIKSLFEQNALLPLAGALENERQRTCAPKK